MKILEKLANARLAVILDTSQGGHMGFDIGNMAQVAITKGFGSQEWADYMTLFVDTKAQLDRLTTVAAGDDTYFPKGRAYIVANGTCGAETDTFTGKGVDPIIDDGLDPTPDGLIVDPGTTKPPGGAVRKFATPKIGRLP